MTTKFLLTLLSFAFLFFSVNAKDMQENTNKIPINLQEAVNTLKELHNDSTKQEIMAMTEDEFTANAHMSIGMWLRNNWGLWQKGELVSYFHSIGVYHPDDMSGVILTSYYRELKGLDWQVDAQVEYYQKYWEEAEKEKVNKLEILIEEQLQESLKNQPAN